MTRARFGEAAGSGTIAGMLDDVIAGAAAPPQTDPPTVSVGTAERPLLPTPWAIIAAVLSGLITYLAFPPVNLWFLAPVGVAALALTTYRRDFWGGAGLGALAGLALLLPMLRWAGGYVGAVWLFLPVGESAYFALLGGASALVTPVLMRWRW